MDANKEKAPEGATTEALVSITHEKEIDMSRSNLAQSKKNSPSFALAEKKFASSIRLEIRGLLLKMFAVLWN